MRQPGQGAAARAGGGHHVGGGGAADDELLVLRVDRVPAAHASGAGLVKPVKLVKIVKMARLVKHTKLVNRGNGRIGCKGRNHSTSC